MKNIKISKKIFALLLLIFFVTSPASATPVFQITTTTPSVNVPPGGTALITYTVQNVSGINMTGMQYFPPPLTTISNASTCGARLANQASCTIVLIFHAPSTPGEMLLGPLGVCGFNGRICSQPDQANRVHIIITSGAIGVTGGQDLTGTQPPLLVVSTDSLQSFAVKSVPGSPSNGSYTGVSCTGTGSNAICVSVGGSTSTPILAVSTDAASTWTLKSVSGITAAFFNGVSCIGSGSTAICNAVGQDNTGTQPPLTAVSIDGANTWTTKSISGAPATGFLIASGCTGSGNTAVCADGGGTGNDPMTSAPLIVVSTDGANTWSVKTVTGAPATAFFASTSCTGNGGTAICAAVGQDNTNPQPAPLLVVSTDGGNTWSTKSISMGPTNGFLNQVICTNTTCVAVGVNFDTGAALLAVSTDGANTWTVKSIAVAGGVLNGVNCTTDTSVCVAVGIDELGGILVAVSTDDANTWTVKSVTGAATSSELLAVNCTGTGSSALCFASGEINPLSGAPIVAASTDGGNTWAIKSISGAPTVGILSTASGASAD
jgi:hypothetical protein